jgi:5-formyltetrahydrofolate cyclo-ligase
LRRSRSQTDGDLRPQPTGGADSDATAFRKTRLRALARERIASVSAADRLEKSERIVARLEALDVVRAASVLLVHRSLPSEVATEALLAAALDRDQRVFAPRVDGPRLRFVRVALETRWRRSALGVLEPEAGDPLEMTDLRKHGGVVVVPGLAFDEGGGRLGRGGGHYDRFLREARGTARIEAIAVAFELQIVAEVPRLDHDESVDRIVTEAREIIPPRVNASG